MKMPEKMTVSVEVTKEAYELGQALVEVVKATKAALADGWQPGTDVPAVLMASIAALPKGVDGAQKLGDESKSTVEFISAFALAGKDLAALFLNK
jgi:hypothetical protein